MSSSSSTLSYTRFSDENYKNWLKTTESLYMLRSCIQDFIEKETETYHNSLRNKTYLKGQTCKRTCCDIKSACELCEYWRKEIEASHNGSRNGIHWDNCRPHLWSKEKWEVAKAHMPRGHKKHCKFAEFDVAAILNLMSSCKHFNIPGKYVTNVINVRNSAMHSPDLKISKEDMNRHHNTVLQLAKILEPKIPKLKDLEKKITQFNNILDKNFNEAPCEVDGQQVDLQTMEVLNREQQALKDRIEDFIARFEGNQDENDEEKPEDMESILDFLEQNKDLLENLGPEVEKLKEMQAKVDQHEEKITKLGDRVDHLEKVTLDPVFPGNPLRYKNHLYEYCRAKKWTGDKWPVFTEILEAQGYRAEVKVNGQSFFGQRVINDKKNAHQEVAYIALKQLKLQEESTDEPLSSVTQPEASCSSSSGITFFGKVTVDLDQEVASDRCASVEEATEAAYKVLWERFRISAPAEGRTYRSLIMEYFNTQRFQKPTELFVQNDDDTTICKLKLVGPFTFYDKDGSTKKRTAEQQAAKVALQHLSGILNCVVSGTEENFKGVLKEHLEMLHLKTAVYETQEYKEISDDHVTSGISWDLATSAELISQAAEKEHSELKSKSISTTAQPTSGQETVCDPVPVLPDPQESSSPAAQKKKPGIDCPGMTFFGKVTVDLNQEVASDKCSSKEEATEAAYKVLWERFRISAPAEGQTYRTLIMDHFNTHDLQKPTEEFVDDDNTTICKLKFNGPFSFYDKDGANRRKLAEQQAAKVALQHLSGILNCVISDTEENFKGVLKERLEMLHLKTAVYETQEYKDEIREEKVTSGISPHISDLSIGQAAEKEHSELKSKSISTSAQPTSGQESVRDPVPVLPDPQKSSSPERKKPRIDFPEIDVLFSVYNLKPPHVKMENIKCNTNFKCTVEINLEKYTCVNKQGYNSKKEAIQKTYLLFGRAVSILDSSTDEKTPNAKVKQFFSQNSLPLPQDDVEGSAPPFYCSIKNISCTVEYTEQGSTEDEAKSDALQKALSSLSPLFDYASITGADSAEDVQNQLSSMLKGAGQKDPVISLEPVQQACVQLSFCDYTVKCTCQNSKKAARNHLSARILGLLGVETGANDASLRNRLNEWFVQQHLPQPVFEDTDEVLGAKATFSVPLTCYSPDWEDSWEMAKEKLHQVLKERFIFLNDKNN